MAFYFFFNYFFYGHLQILDVTEVFWNTNVHRTS